MVINGHQRSSAALHGSSRRLEHHVVGVREVLRLVRHEQARHPRKQPARAEHVLEDVLAHLHAKGGAVVSTCMPGKEGRPLRSTCMQ